MEYLWILISFISGSLPFAVIIAKGFKGIDPRKEGSKNPGTTNVCRLCGLPLGLLTLACDVLKGTIPVYFSLILFPDSLFVQTLSAFAAFIGHIKSPFLNFHGGKGVATGIGVLIPLAFIPLIIGLLTCVLIIIITGYVSAGALALYASLPILYLIFDERWFYLSIIMLLLVLYTHRGNIQRLLKGEEKHWRKKKSIN